MTWLLEVIYLVLISFRIRPHIQEVSMIVIYPLYHHVVASCISPFVPALVILWSRSLITPHIGYIMESLYDASPYRLYNVIAVWWLHVYVISWSRCLMTFRIGIDVALSNEIGIDFALPNWTVPNQTFYITSYKELFEKKYGIFSYCHVPLGSLLFVIPIKSQSQHCSVLWYRIFSCIISFLTFPSRISAVAKLLLPVLNYICMRTVSLDLSFCFIVLNLNYQESRFCRFIFMVTFSLLLKVFYTEVIFFASYC